MKYRVRVSALGLALAIAIPAQVFPGSPLPGGRRGVGLPPAVPGGGRTSKQKKEKPAEEPLASFAGTLKRADSKALVVEGDDSNTTEFVCTKKTKFYDGSKKVKPSAVKPGEHVSVEARHGLDGSLEAVNVRVEHPKS